MEIKKILIHLLFSSYTIGFILGGFTFFLVELDKNFYIKLSTEDILCFFMVIPIAYWVYRYFGMVFNDQNFKIKIFCICLSISGFFFGAIFFEVLLK